MSLDWYMKSGWCALGAAVALAATAAFASALVPQTSVPETPVKLALADSTETVAQVPGSTTPRSYPPIEAGVRRAAAQGPEALRRYCWRTRMIYDFYFWNFVNQE
jgi:hypothetical protein